MTGFEFAFWCGIMLVGFAFSALYSGMETGAYSLNRVRLQIYAHQHHRPARLLRRMADDPVRLLTTLLIGNNIANYMGTAGLAVLLEGWGIGQWQAIVLNTIIVTPILFIFGETLPKDLFAAYADRLMYRLAWLLEGSRHLFTWLGLVPLIAVATKLVMVGLGQKAQIQPFHPRRQVQALVREGVGYGLLSDDQSAIAERVLQLATRTVADEMVPWSEVITVNVDDEPAVLWTLADRTSRSRFPVMDGSGNVAGEVAVTEALLHTPEACPAIRELMRTPLLVPAHMPLRRGLAELQHHKAALAIVIDDRQQPVGILTIKDCVETITGELASW
ncbi:CNNM domain-containing protein [Phycisphaerales bacterium AB-hyl4]|uniref:CNNM domain-containing protein n=1 Tax=Natronomicrosphaera hydrolytica TaxID=3242702 RepID=A0ABV4U6T6_9BACT